MPRPAKPITINGKTYASQREAARELKICTKTLLRRLNQGRNVYASKPHPLANPILTPFGEFKSLYEAWKYTGIKKDTIKRRIKNKINGYRYL